MGLWRIFSREGPLEDFSKFFPGVRQSGEICFFFLENNLFAEIFKIQGGQAPIPTPMCVAI